MASEEGRLQHSGVKRQFTFGKRQFLFYFATNLGSALSGYSVNWKMRSGIDLKWRRKVDHHGLLLLAPPKSLDTSTEPSRITRMFQATEANISCSAERMSHGKIQHWPVSSILNKVHVDEIGLNVNVLEARRSVLKRRLIVDRREDAMQFAAKSNEIGSCKGLIWKNIDAIWRWQWI